MPATGTTTIRGQVRAIPETDAIYPLIGVPVTLLRNGQFVRMTYTEALDGRYTLPNVPIADNLTIQVNLRNESVYPAPFEVRWQTPPAAGRPPGPLVQVVTHPFATTDTQPLTKNITLYADALETEPVAPVPKAWIADLGVIYYHTHQAWELADQFGIRLSLSPPVPVFAFSSDPVVAWYGPHSRAPGVAFPTYINIDAFSSLYADGNRPDNREWHEYGHNVMADMLGDLMPRCPGDLNHGGVGGNSYVNPSTTDSWVEGFAEFYSMMVGARVGGDRTPWQYHVLGTDVNLETNYRAWVDEEFAVAGLLWDLVDPADMDDASPLDDAPGSAAIDYADCVEILPGTLWNILETAWNDDVPRAPVALRQNYPYLFDIKHLYDVLKFKGIGQSHSRGRAWTDLDELFIAHGFYADLGPQDRAYQGTEEVGRAADPARPERRDDPGRPGSFVAFSARDSQTGAAIPVQRFYVEVRFPAPYALHDFAYFQNTSATPDHLYFSGPDPQYPATVRITPLVTRWVATEPLVFTNADYWQAMAAQPTDHFLQHTFQMKPAQAVYLPLVGRGAGGTEAASAQPAPARQRAARACSPDDPVTPTPTPTLTPTRAPAPIVSAVEPSSAAQGSSVQVIVYGYYFQPGAVPAIGATALQSVEYLGPEPGPSGRWRLRGILPAGLPIGMYDVSVRNPDGQVSSIINAFTITSPALPDGDADGPTLTRPCNRIPDGDRVTHEHRLDLGHANALPRTGTPTASPSATAHEHADGYPQPDTHADIHRHGQARRLRPAATPTGTGTPQTTRTPTPTATPAGIYGKVTYHGAAAAALSLSLYWWNGADWLTRPERRRPRRMAATSSTARRPWPRVRSTPCTTPNSDVEPNPWPWLPVELVGQPDRELRRRRSRMGRRLRRGRHSTRVAGR